MKDKKKLSRCAKGANNMDSAVNSNKCNELNNNNNATTVLNNNSESLSPSNKINDREIYAEKQKKNVSNDQSCDERYISSKKDRIYLEYDDQMRYLEDRKSIILPGRNGKEELKGQSISYNVCKVSYYYVWRCS